MRVSVAGVDASLAQFNNLIFDGNQPPLRLAGTGYVLVTVVAFTSNSNGSFANGPSVPITPSGTTPIFLTSVRQPTTGAVNPGAVGNDNSPAFRTYNSYGMGGAIYDTGSSKVFTGINFNRDNGGNGLFGGGQGIVNYAIMKNYQ